MKKYIFFDLDGTLTDSAEGITNSVAYVLKHYGISVEDKSSAECVCRPAAGGELCEILRI